MSNEEHCFLGIEDGEVTTKDIPHLDYTSNVLGGRPNYPPNIVNFRPKCVLCDQELYLLVQIYAPLSESNYHRTLYIFCCPKKKCWRNCDSWQCHRTQYCGEVNAKNTSSDFNASAWLEDADNWDDSLSPEFPDESSKPLSTQADDTLASAPASHYPDPADGSGFKSFHIAVVEESPQSTDATSHVSCEIDDRACDKAAGEAYEKSKPKHGDLYFWNITKKIQDCPNQLIRYRGWNSTPLYFYEPLLPLSCKYCGGVVSFELQVLPTLLSKLASNDGADLNLDYCTVILMSCNTSCWEDSERFRQEQLIIQFEKSCDLDKLPK